jgi:hypothetical protein
MTFSFSFLDQLKAERNVVVVGSQELVNGADQVWSGVKTGKKSTLIVMSTFDGLMEARKYFFIEKLFVLTMTSELTMKNFYANKSTKSFFSEDENITAGALRK